MSTKYGGALVSGAVIYGSTGGSLGTPGAQIPATGSAGPSVVYPYVTLPADAAVEFRALLQAAPSGATSFVLHGDGSFTLTAPDGTYSFTFDLLRDGVSQGVKTSPLIVIGAALVQPGPGSIALTGYAPAVAQSGSNAVAPSATSIAFTGYAPTIARSANNAVALGAGSVVLAGYPPTITQIASNAVAAGARSIALAGYAPSIAQTNSQALSAIAGGLSLTGFAPTVSAASAPSQGSTVTTLVAQLIPRSGTTAQIATSVVVVAPGEKVFNTDTGAWKTGDGVRTVAALPYDPVAITSIKTVNGQSIVGTGDLVITGGSTSNTRVAVTNAIPLDSVAGKAMPLTTGQAIQITSATTITVGAGPVDGGVCVADYEVSASLDLSACLPTAAVTAGYRYRITYEYSLLEGKPYAYVVQGSALQQFAPNAPTLTLGTPTSTTQPLTIGAPVADGAHGAAVTYSLYKSSDSGATWSLVSSVLTSGATSVTGLSEQTAYQYRASASNATGTGAFSTVVGATTPAGNSPVLAFVTPPALSGGNVRTVTGSKDYFIPGVNFVGSGSGRYIRKAAGSAPVGLLTNVGMVNGATDAGVYGGLGEGWYGTNGIDDGSRLNSPDWYQGSCEGITAGGSGGAVWGVTAPLLNNERDGLTILMGIYTDGWTLNATVSDGSSPDMFMSLPQGNVLRTLRFRGTTAGATVRLEIRGPAGQGCGVIGCFLDVQ